MMSKHFRSLFVFYVISLIGCQSPIVGTNPSPAGISGTAATGGGVPGVAREENEGESGGGSDPAPQNDAGDPTVGENKATAGLPSGPVAPHPDVGNPMEYALKGVLSQECSYTDGRTKIHVRSIVSSPTGHPVPSPTMDGVRVYYSKFEGEEGVYYRDIALTKPPASPNGLQILKPPSNYVDFQIVTSDPNSLHVFPIKFNLYPLPVTVGSDEADMTLTEDGPSPVPSCPDMSQIKALPKH